MQRLAKYDIATIATRRWRRLPVEIGFGLVCAGVLIAVRSAVDLVAPTAGPFAMVYPTVLIATLFGHWQAGLTAYLISFIWAWWFVLEPMHSFYFVDPSDPVRVLINALCAAIVIILAEAFRRAVQDAVHARDAEIERRDMLMRELEHRTKNNFALVASLLALQHRRLQNEEARAALEEAMGRVHIFAQAYENLAATESEGFPVPVGRYLEDVATRVAASAFAGNVSIDVQADNPLLHRRIAVAIGLFVNETLTNCAKYAFPDGRDGTVTVRFAGDAKTWRLTVADNGVGLDTPLVEDGEPAARGLGSGLLKAFAQQAEAAFWLEQAAHGTGHVVVLERMPAE